MIDHRHRYVFVHIPKTAGTSLKRRLAGYDLDKRWQPDPAQIQHLYSHLTGAQLQAELEAVAGVDAAAYFRFTFVRNPWDRVLSAFLYLSAGGGNQVRELPRVAAVKPFKGDFRRFVGEGLAPLQAEVPHLLPQHLWSHDGLSRPLDFIGRFERLEADYAEIARRLGLDPTAPLPHLRASRRRPYPEYYDADSRAVVAQVYARDIALYGYRFED